LENGHHRTRDTRETRRSWIEEQKTLREELGPVTRLMSREVEVGSRVTSIAYIYIYIYICVCVCVCIGYKCKSLVNCRSGYHTALEFWNLVDTYNLVVVKGKKSWLKVDISMAEAFRADFKPFKMDRAARSGGGGVICVKNIIASTECSGIYKHATKCTQDKSPEVSQPDTANTYATSKTITPNPHTHYTSCKTYTNTVQLTTL
jgi:hypothetical protein